ncbi:MAG: glycosyltransferase family 4 protein [Nanoarchaeota archaeon]|nr:glycosyltransferase family 4 protein [Nanoarchaeota archaeon]
MKKKVLIITTAFPRWKNDTYPSFVYELAKTLSKKEFIVKVLSPHYLKAKFLEKENNLTTKRFLYFYPLKYQKLAYNMLPNIKDNKLLIFEIPSFFLSYILNSIRILKKEKIKVINSHWIIPSGFIGAILKKLYGIKHICTIHAGGITILNKLPFKRLIANFIVKNTDYFTIVSSHGKELLLNLTSPNLRKDTEKKIRIVSMGIYSNKYKYVENKKKLREKNNIKSKYVLLFVGRLTEKKGVKYLLEAMPQIIKEFKDVELLIVGDGVLKKELMKLTKDLKIEKNVKFLGYIVGNKKNEYLSLSDLFISSSIVTQYGDTEGLPVVIMEAIASGLPVVATNVGGTRDIVVNNKNGFLINQRNSKEIVNSVYKMLNDPELTKRFSNNSLKMSKKYGWEVIAKEYSKIILN